jgi:hypothetical protein
MTGSQATMVAAHSDLLWDVPDEWTLEDAATVPVVYATVSPLRILTVILLFVSDFLFAEMVMVHVT